MSLLRFKHFCHTSKYIKDKTKLELALKKFIDNVSSPCLCEYISSARKVNAKFTYYVAGECKKRCNFCRYKKVFILYDYLKELPYGDVKYLIGFDKMLANDMLVHNLTEKHIKLLSLEDMSDILLAKPDIKFNGARGIRNW